MSYTIEYDRVAFIVQPEQIITVSLYHRIRYNIKDPIAHYGERHYIVFQSLGSNNVIPRHGTWQFTAQGYEHEVMVEICEQAKHCLTNCLQYQGHRLITPEKHLKAYRNAIKNAIPLSIEALHEKMHINSYGFHNISKEIIQSNENLENPFLKWVKDNFNVVEDRSYGSLCYNAMSPLTDINKFIDYVTAIEAIKQELGGCYPHIRYNVEVINNVK